MANIGDVSVININGNEMSLKDAALREVVNEIVQAIGANNDNIASRINDLHSRSFDYTLDITSNNDSELASIQDGVYKLHYVTVTGSDENEIRTLYSSGILIQDGTNQYLYKEGELLKRTKSNNTWGSWQSSILMLPTVTSSDNGKILMVVNGAWTLVSPSILYSGSGAPNNAQGNDGDIYVQTGGES